MSHSPEFLKIVNDAKSRVKETDVARRPGALEERRKAAARRRARGRRVGERPHRRRGPPRQGRASSATSRRRFPDKSEEIILYCGGGFRSALSADNLQKMGYRNVLSDGRRLARLGGRGRPRREMILKNFPFASAAGRLPAAAAPGARRPSAGARFPACRIGSSSTRPSPYKEFWTGELAVKDLSSRTCRRSSPPIEKGGGVL
jgi:rhodanese-related sulfurtransferase